MKKIYSVALAAAVALSASAAPLQLKQADLKNVDRSNTLRSKVNAETERASKAMGMKKLPQADGSWTISGNYDFYIGDFYFSGGAGETVVRASVIDNGDGTVTFNGPAFPVDVIASYDAATGAIAFSPINYGQLSFSFGDYYVKFDTGLYNWETDNVDPVEVIKAEFSAEDGVIFFEEEDGNFCWTAYSDEACTQLAGYLDWYDVYGMVQLEPVDEVQEGKWQSVGMAKFVDAWVLAAYTIGGEPIDPTEMPWEVELQQNVENQNIYRLWAPYWAEGCPIASLNKSEYQGQIVFDITNPDYVRVIPGMPAGFANSNGEFYCFNYLGWQISGYGDKWDESELPGLIEWMEDHNQTPFSTFKDNVVTVDKSVFDFSPACQQAYSWRDVVTYISTITFPEGNAVEGVAVENAPAKYYNLQGVEIANPEAGQVVIVRKGGKASKTIAK